MADRKTHAVSLRELVRNMAFSAPIVLFVLVATSAMGFAAYSGSISIEGSAVFDDSYVPILEYSVQTYNYSIFRGETGFTPADLTTRFSAYNRAEGDISDRIVRECSLGEERVNCPTSWDEWGYGDYKITYSVASDRGLPTHDPVTVGVEIWQFMKLASGQYHGIALTTHGRVWTWGYNNNGQRGIGNTTATRAPTELPQSHFGDVPVVDVAGARNTSCAVVSGGQAYCWGSDGDGALGNGGANTNVSVPAAVSMPNRVGFSQISGSHGTSVNGAFGALGDDGNIYTWGLGSGWRLGTGLNTSRTEPTQITSSGDFVSAYQGNSGGVGINTAGQVYVWGNNLYGQLATGSTGAVNATTSTPRVVSGLSNAVQVSYGGYGDNGFVLVLNRDGEVYGWGRGYGVNGASTNVTSPQLIPGLPSVRFINAGADFSHFVVGDELYALGNANYGELFGGNTTTRTTATLSTLDNVAGNVGLTTGGYDNAWVLDRKGIMVWGIGFSDTTGNEFGSSTVTGTSTRAVVPWSMSTTVREW